MSELRPFPPHSAASGRILAAPRRPWRFPFANRVLTVRPLLPGIASERLGSSGLVVDARVGGDAVSVALPAGLVALLVDRLEPLAGWSALGSEARAALLEALLAEPLEALEARTGRRIELVAAAETAAAPRADFGLEIGWGDFTLPAALALGPTLLAPALRAAARQPLRRPEGLGASVAFRRGFALLGAAELKALAPGDAVVIDPDLAGRVVAVTGERFVAACTIVEAGLRLAEPLFTRPVGHSRHLMSNDTMDEALEGAPKPGAIADLPIKLVFDVGRIELPLGELETIGEGHVFPLDRSQSDAVEIVAQGRVIGRGEIVALDGFTAVRVTRLY